MGILSIQAQFVGHGLSIGSIDHHHVGVIATMKKVHRSGEQPVAESSNEIVIFALGITQIA